MIGKKKCSKCKVVKSLDLFYKDRTTNDKRMARCKECHNMYMRSDEGKKVRKKAARRYYRTEKGKKLRSEGNERYRQTDNWKTSYKRSQVKYEKSEKAI